MRFRLELIGRFRFQNTETGHVFALRNGASFLGLLACSPGGIAREAIINALWHDVTPEVAKNRLRVALSKLRDTLGNALIENGTIIQLSKTEVSCDLWEVLDYAEQAKNAIDPTTEFQALEHLVAKIADARNPLCPEIQEFESARLLRSDLDGYLLRALDLGLEHQRYHWVAQLASIRLNEPGLSGPLWARYLRARTYLNEADPTLKEVYSLPKSTLSDEQLQQAIAWSRLHSYPSESAEPSLDSNQREVAMKVIELLLEKRPDLMRPVFSSPETLSLSGSNPRTMLTILERIVENPAEQDYHWERCMARMIGLQAWVNDVDAVLKTSERLLACTTTPAILRATWNSVAIAHSIRRNWDEAMYAVERTIEHAAHTGEEVDTLSARGNRAYFLCHQARFVESDAEYEDSFRRLTELDTTRSQFELVIGGGNRALIPVYQDDWQLAKARLEEAYAVRTNGPHRVPMGLLLPCLAVSRLKEGRMDEVVPMLKQGLMECFATESSRFQQQALEFAALAALELKLFELAFGLLDYVENWRAKTRMPRSQAEIQLVNHIIKQVPKPSRQPMFGASQSPKEVGAEVMKAVRRDLRFHA